MPPIELLSPAKDLETGMAAINCGADAVYIGATKFGAREAAGNPLSDLEQLLAYAHRYWARVYVTVNTLLFDHELEEASRLIKQLYDIGIDALIIQDTGLLELDLPPIPLIASTQMHNHTPERVAFLEQVGFKRAILARELSLPEIRDIRARTTLELETFIHGALCVSYSGQCYLSYALGGRSGNRGQCAQPCRKKYSLIDGDGKIISPDRHWLSLKDLNLSNEIGDLLDAGVTSFKVEGRLKDKCYVMNVVSFYRRLLDGLLPGRNLKPASSGKSNINFSPDLNKTFNRGYTTYFIHGRGDTIASPNTPKSLGERLGKVIKTTKNSFRLEEATPQLHAGDGICFFNRQNELDGTFIRAVQGQDIFPEKINDISKGMMIYRNHDPVFLSRLEKNRVDRKISVKFELRGEKEGIRLFAVDEDGCHAEASLQSTFETAGKPEAARETMYRQIQKTGGTEFTCTKLKIEMDEIVFIPVATLNNIRRVVLEQLREARRQNRPILSPGIPDASARFPENSLSYLGNVANHLAQKFYRRHGVANIEPAAETGLDMRGRKVMTTRLCIRHELGACSKNKKENDLIEPLTLMDEENNGLELQFNCESCEMNIYLLENK